jgi:hypothetical protein
MSHDPRKYVNPSGAVADNAAAYRGRTAIEENKMSERGIGEPMKAVSWDKMTHTRGEKMPGNMMGYPASRAPVPQVPVVKTSPANTDDLVNRRGAPGGWSNFNGNQPAGKQINRSKGPKFS